MARSPCRVVATSAPHGPESTDFVSQQACGILSLGQAAIDVAKTTCGLSFTHCTHQFSLRVDRRLGRQFSSAPRSNDRGESVGQCAVHVLKYGRPPTRACREMRQIVVAYDNVALTTVSSAQARRSVVWWLAQRVPDCTQRRRDWQRAVGKVVVCRPSRHRPGTVAERWSARPRLAHVASRTSSTYFKYRLKIRLGQH
jgi:hypothetical protein